MYSPIVFIFVAGTLSSARLKNLRLGKFKMRKMTVKNQQMPGGRMIHKYCSCAVLDCLRLKGILFLTDAL